MQANHPPVTFLIPTLFHPWQTTSPTEDDDDDDDEEEEQEEEDWLSGGDFET